jgi:molecular chaperone HscC
MAHDAYIIGIDLGTTHSAVAVMADGTPTLIRNALGELLTPSVVGVDDGALLVGEPARELAVSAPERTAAVFKRQMGTDWSIELDGRTWTPEELSAAVLRTLQADAEAYLGQPVTQAVITVPAYFNDDQRRATLRAGEIAGLEVQRLISEPTAAAIAYGLHQRDAEQISVVVDLGGGTFDVSVVELFEGAVEVRASAGESFLGGEDFTRLLAARLIEEQGGRFESWEVHEPVRLARLLRHCEHLKRSLTTAEAATMPALDADGCVDRDQPERVVGRSLFEVWTGEVLDRLDAPVRRGLSDARVTPAQVDEVVLVGGATRMPAVRERVQQLFEREPICELDPDLVVAMGAAVQAGLIARDSALDDLVVTDVSPFTLGVATTKEFSGEFKPGYFLPVIHRNTTIPCSRMQVLGTLVDGQTEVVIEVYQGENRRVDDNLVLGSLRVTGIPRGPAGQEVAVRFTYDLNGVLELESTVVATGRQASTVITAHAKGLSKREIKAAVAAMNKLKVHPRDVQQNQYLLKRAERLYRDVPPYQLEQLSQVIDNFESALASQDPEQVAQWRDILTSVLDSLDPEHGSDRGGSAGSED